VIAVARWLALGAGALLLTLAVSWPLPRCFAICLGASEDPVVSVYFLSWLVHSLTSPGVRLFDAGIFAPYPNTFALGEAGPAYALFALPARLVSGSPVVAHNVVVVAAYALAALGAAALGARLAGGTGPGIVAAVAFAYTPFLLGQAYVIQTLAVFWVPWLFLAVEGFLTRPTWVGAALVASLWLALGLTGLNVFAFTSVAAAVFAIAVALARRPGPDRRHLVRLAVVGVPALALLAAYLTPFRTVVREWHLGRSLAQIERHSASFGYFVGLPRGAFLYRMLGLEATPGLDTSALLSGVTVTVLVAVGLGAFVRGHPERRATLWPYLAMAGVAAILALGPTLSTPWGALPLPYRALYAFAPGFGAIRTAGRFLLVVALVLAILAGIGAAHLTRRLAPGRRALVLGSLTALILVESVAVPFPGVAQRLDPAEISDAHRWLATRDPRTVVLELPMREDWRKLGVAAFHLRPMVNGFSSFIPPHYHLLVRAMEEFPDARSLALVRSLQPDLIFVDRTWLEWAHGTAAIASLADGRGGLRLDRRLGRYDVYRLAGAEAPRLEELRVTARVSRLATRLVWYGCVTLENRGPGWVPLYPLHRLRFEVEPDPAGPVARGGRWLPLDLAPGASETDCVELGPKPDAIRVHGEVEGPGRRYRFTAAPDTPPAPLTRAGW